MNNASPETSAPPSELSLEILEFALRLGRGNKNVDKILAEFLEKKGFQVGQTLAGEWIAMKENGGMISVRQKIEEILNEESRKIKSSQGK